jgi:peptide/nickel transport system permease protein
LSFRRFLLVRLGWAILALWLALTVLFVITRVISLRAEDFRSPVNRNELYRAFVRELSLDEPVHKRYGIFLWDSLNQDLGHSILNERSSRAIVVQALPATLSLVLPALGLAVLVGWAVAIPLSRASPRRRYVWRIPVGVAIGIPSLLLGLWLSYYVGFKAGWLPITGYCDFFDPPSGSGCGGAVDWTEHLVLPWITLGLFFAAIYTRVLRAWFRDLSAASARIVLGWFGGRGAPARWPGSSRVISGLRSVPQSSSRAPSRPGLGRTLVIGLDTLDFRVAEAALLYAAFLAIGIHFVVDLIVGALDKDLRAEWPVAGMPVRT